MKIVFDTNELINENQTCVSLVNALVESDAPPFMLGLDNAGEIEKEYDDYVVNQNADSESIIRKIWSLIVDDRHRYTIPLDSTLKANELKELTTYGCGNQIEPTLFGMALRNNRTLILLSGKLRGHFSRGYNKCLNQVSTQYLPNNEKLFREAMSMLDYGGKPYPSSYQDLRELLDRYKVSGKRQEQDFLEFKEGPFNFAKFERDNPFNKSLRARTVKAVCGMLNTIGNAWVFVGVEPDGTISGFPPEYRKGGKVKGDVDLVQQLISQDICNIKPNPMEMGSVRMWSIEIKDDRIVISISTKKPRANVVFCYNGVAWGRLGTTVVDTKKPCL